VTFGRVPLVRPAVTRGPQKEQGIVKTIFHISDRVTDGGGLSGTVVCVIETGEFSADYNAAEWAHLETGVMVMAEEAGLIHYPDSAKLAVSNEPTT
jgi:hypothetical protein